VAGVVSLAWQWIASLSLSGAYWLASPAWAFSGWKLPFFTTFALPVIVFALMLLDVPGLPLTGSAVPREGRAD
jgi:hypothetical protein